ncbi:MAG: hydroxymethylglutaryl-CoA lyase [Acidimicrobiales bacterium]
MAEVSIREVGPRDGLQREAPMESARRLELIGALAACGFGDMEVAAFVSERAVPAMAGAAEIVAGLPAGSGCTWWALVPNLVGAERATTAGITDVTVTVSASEGYSQRNVSMSVAESAAQALAIIPKVSRADVVISCAFGSPYEATIDPHAVAALAARFTGAGATVTLADTTGVASPRRLGELLDLTGTTVGLHLHDTRGTALVNAYAAFELGVRRFDTSVGGLGGSPFADDAGGNLATEDLVHLLDDLGVATGIDLGRLVDVDASLREWLGRPLAGRVAETELRRRAAPQ